MILELDLQGGLACFNPPLYTDVLSNVSIDWSNILSKIYIQSTSGEYIFPVENMSWSVIPQFPACQTVDLNRYLNLSKIAPSTIFFLFKKIQNLGISVEIGDKRKSLKRRKLIQNSFEYEGAKFELESLYYTKMRTYALTISQRIDLETDKGKNCKDYPNENFSSYNECDENFVYNEVVEKFNMMPFWAAKNLKEITNITYY